MKRKSGGNLQEIDPQKEVADYLVFSTYKNEAQMEADSWKAHSNYAYSHYKNKISKKNIDKMMSTNPKESARSMSSKISIKHPTTDLKLVIPSTWRPWRH